MKSEGFFWGWFQGGSEECLQTESQGKAWVSSGQKAPMTYFEQDNDMIKRLAHFIRDPVNVLVHQKMRKQNNS